MSKNQIFNKMFKYLSNHELECGCDEAGRGCLAGPVTAAAVIFKKDFFDELINDSKILNSTKRTHLKELIKENALTYNIAFLDAEKIDEINILNASILAMHHAIDKLTQQPEFIIIDGNRFKPYQDIPYECVVKGDSKYLSIAAASILAKTARDEYMEKIHEEFPMYNWKKNKGYPTKEHREAIRKYGITPYHRKTFKLLEDQLSLNL